MTTKISLDKIKTDGGTQARAALNDAVVDEYCEAILAGADLPAVTVFHDGKSYWLADGFHRFHAHRKARAIEIDADVRTGTKRDAILHSVGANENHGLRRTTEDKLCALRTLFEDKEWGAWSDREIARACSVSPTFVGTHRPKLTVHVDSEKPAERTYTTKHGTKAVMDTAAIGKANGEGAAAALHPSTPQATASVIEGANVTTPEQLGVRPTPDVSSLAGPESSANEMVDDEIPLLVELQQENARLIDLLKAAEADDLAAEAIKWRRCYENATRQQSEAMDSAHRSQGREKKTKDQLMRCGRAVGEEDPRKIALAVERMAKQVRALA